MTNIADLSVIVGADIQDLQTKLKNAEGSIKGFRDRASATMSKVKSVALPIGGALGTLGIAAAKTAIDFESNFANVKKTVDGTDAQLDALADALRDMGTSTDLSALPNAVAELTNIAAIAGQLGVKTEDIADFTEVIGGLTVATNMSGDAAATFAARFANVTGMDMKNIADLGNTLVELGNTSAAQESEIAEMANRLATLANVGFEPSEILGYSAALTSLGISAELGGSNTVKAVNAIIEAVAVGGSELDAMATTASLTVDEFQKLADTDIEGAFAAIVSGLSEMSSSDAILALQDMGLTGQEMSRIMTTLAGSQDFVSDKVDQANKTWGDSSALMEEVGAKADTTEGSLNQTLNLLIGLAETVGRELLPPINDALQQLNTFLQDLDIEAGIRGWESAFHNFGRIVNIVIGDVQRRMHIMMLDIKLAATDAQIALQEALPAAMQDTTYIADLKSQALSLHFDRQSFEDMDRLNDNLVSMLRNVEAFGKDTVLTMGEGSMLFGDLLPMFESNPEAVSPLLKMNLADSLHEAFKFGQTDQIEALIDLTDYMDFDPGQINSMLQDAMAVALDTQDIDLASYIYQVAIALDADVDLVSFNEELTALLNQQAISATVKANVTVQGKIVDFNLDGAGAAKFSGGRDTIPVFDGGGLFRSGSGSGLAMLHDGERVLTPEQTRAFDSGRVGSGVTIYYSSFGETPFDSLKKLRTAALDAGY